MLEIVTNMLAVYRDRLKKAESSNNHILAIQLEAQIQILEHLYILVLREEK